MSALANVGVNSATLRTTASGGLIFDHYGRNDYKYVALDVQSGRVVLGHSRRGGTDVDASTARTLLPNTDYSLVVRVKGLTISVLVGGSLIFSYAFNGVIVDGGFGLYAQRGTTSFDSMRIRTNDPAFPVAGPTQAGSTPPPLISATSSSTISSTSTTTISSTSSGAISAGPSTGSSSSSGAGPPGPGP